MPKKPIVIQVGKDITRDTVIVLAQGDYSDQEPLYAHETGQGGRGLHFKFVGVIDGDYCDAWSKIQDIVKSGICLSIYLVHDFERTKNKHFVSKTRRSLNRCNAGFRKILEKSSIGTWIIDRQNGTTSHLLSFDFSDRKKAHYLNVG